MERLSARIERFLRTEEGDFPSLVLELFRAQYATNLPYRAFVDAQGLSAYQVHRWEDIPAVPVRAFKSAALCTFPVGRAAAVFESSRTTGQVPGRHYVKDLLYYETAVVRSFSRAVLPDQAQLPFLILAPSPGEAPRSSLTWMFDTVKRRCGTSGSDYFVLRGRLDEPRLAYVLDRCVKQGQPVALLGTTLAYLAFFDYAKMKSLRYTLPPGSRLFDTGGMKTSTRQVSREAFIDQVVQYLGIAEEQCINEYGMCELSSQFYGRGRSAHLEGPAWVRTLVIDPATGRPAPDGKPGLLRHIDLANVDSVLAVLTEDLGRSEGKGFVLLGRVADSELRGCSLPAESFQGMRG